MHLTMSENELRLPDGQVLRSTLPDFRLLTFHLKAERASTEVQHLTMVERCYPRTSSIKYLESRPLALEKNRYILDLEAVLI